MLAESGIDALSYAALHPNDNARYASFGGTMNPSQPALIRAAIKRLVPVATVRIATDNDEDGAGFAAIIEGLVAQTGRGDMAVERAEPVDAKDWNDVLRRRRESIGT
ncbi:MAG: toprim domain-containing protein [Chromatiaceae bacterium]|nr:toprim domain-containing protein [Chromatiaceae bacterium]MBP6807837.1 toprim domain-containing protein [Chromatiaceae bacterium]MBP8290486.1 toprim domain-containing protein [Chromatiaceae bacterium]